jgi:hypothetical protein
VSAQKIDTDSGTPTVQLCTRALVDTLSFAAAESCIFASKYGIGTALNDPLIVGCDISMVNTLESNWGGGALPTTDVVFDVGGENVGRLAAGISTVVRTTEAEPKEDGRLSDVVPFGREIVSGSALLSLAMGRSTYKPPMVVPSVNVVTDVCDEEDSSVCTTKSAILSRTADASTTVGRIEEIE